jgi:hypothetical protein
MPAPIPACLPLRIISSSASFGLSRTSAETCSDVTLIRSLAERSGAVGPTRAGNLIHDLGLFQWMELPALPGGDLI